MTYVASGHTKNLKKRRIITSGHFCEFTHLKSSIFHPTIGEGERESPVNHGGVANERIAIFGEINGLLLAPPPM